MRTCQSVELFDDLTVEENLLVASQRMGVLSALRDLLLPIAKHPRDDVDWALELCGLTDVKDRLPTELSHGRRKLVGVARALAQRPRLVLMDEPAAGLDTDESAELGRHLRALPEAGVTVLLVDHDMSLVLSVCDSVVVLDFGQVIARGTPEQIRHDESVVAAYLGSTVTDAAAALRGGPLGRLRRRARRARPLARTRTRARSSRCSGPTARARPRRCPRSPGCCRRSAAASRWPARTWPASPPTSSPAAACRSCPRGGRCSSA